MNPAPSNPNQPQNPDTGADQPDQQNTSLESQSPGLEPTSGSDVQIRNVNPPLTPDQVVGLYEKPLEVPALPTLKLQDIKTPPVKNKTIQAHLKAIEAKMTATEKLMKEVVKLQKLQLITEKELHERKRELYQNTFEEYLLDKTIDFEDPDDPKDCVCINLPKSPTSGGGGGALPTPTLTPTPTSPSADGQQDATQPTKKPAQQPSRQPQNPPTTPTSPDGKPGRNRPGQRPSTPTQPTTQPPHKPRPGTRPRPGTPPVRQPRPFPPDVRPVPGPGTRPGPMPVPGEPGAQPINNIRTFSRAQTPVAGAQYRAGLPMGTRGSILSMLGQFGLGKFSQQQVESRINELTKLKTENPEEYKKKLNDLRWEAKNQKVLNPLMQVIGSPDIPAAYILKSLGQLKQEEIPLSLPGMNIDLMPDLNPDGSPITTDTLDTRSEFDKKHGVNYASGGIPGQDLELYNSESQNYFRNISNNIKHSMPRYAGGGLFGAISNLLKPKGLSIKGVQAGFTGMAKEGFDAIMGGDKFRLGKFKPQILGRGAYSAPTLKGAQRYAGATGSLGGSQTPGGVVKTIVPGNARKINLIEPQSAVKPATFDKGKVLADKLLRGDYANSPLANKLRSQLMSGAAQNIGMGLGRTFGKMTQILNAPVIGDMLFPEGTSTYDQLTGPNAYYNAPGYKGPKPSQTLENAQNNLMNNSSNNTPSMVPLPPNYIQIPTRKAKQVPDKSTMSPPAGVNLTPSVFSRQSTYID